MTDNWLRVLGAEVRDRLRCAVLCCEGRLLLYCIAIYCTVLYCIASPYINTQHSIFLPLYCSAVLQGLCSAVLYFIVMRYVVLLCRRTRNLSYCVLYCLQWRRTVLESPFKTLCVATLCHHVIDSLSTSWQIECSPFLFTKLNCFALFYVALSGRVQHRRLRNDARRLSACHRSGRFPTGKMNLIILN